MGILLVNICFKWWNSIALVIAFWIWFVSFKWTRILVISFIILQALSLMADPDFLQMTYWILWVWQKTSNMAIRLKGLRWEPIWTVMGTYLKKKSFICEFGMDLFGKNIVTGKFCLAHHGISDDTSSLVMRKSVKTTFSHQSLFLWFTQRCIPIYYIRLLISLQQSPI